MHRWLCLLHAIKKAESIVHYHECPSTELLAHSPRSQNNLEEDSHFEPLGEWLMDKRLEFGQRSLSNSVMLNPEGNFLGRVLIV